MISLSLGRWSPRRLWARGTSTARLSGRRMRRSRSARRPWRFARRARISASSRAARIAAVWRAYTTHVVARNATSPAAIQWRPLSRIPPLLPLPLPLPHLEGAEPGRARPRVVPDFGGVGPQRLLREHGPERAAATRAHRLPRRTDARPAPVTKRVLDDAILARVIGDRIDPAAGRERRTQRRQRQVELLELLVHHDPQRLKQPREHRRAGARTPRFPRSEERRVGKECRSRWSPYH